MKQLQPLAKRSSLAIEGNSRDRLRKFETESNLVLSVAPLFGENGARRASCIAVAAVADLVFATMAPAARFSARRRLRPASNGRIQDAAAAVAVQLVEGNVRADAAVASVAELGAPRNKEYIQLLKIFLFKCLHH